MKRLNAILFLLLCLVLGTSFAAAQTVKGVEHWVVAPGVSPG